MNASPDLQREERVTFYLSKDLKPEPRSERVHLGQVIRGKQFLGGMPTPRHQSEAEFIEGMTQRRIPQGDVLYSSIWTRNTYEEVRNLTTTPPARNEDDLGLKLAQEIEVACDFDKNQMNKVLMDVTEPQFQQMIKIIAESQVPLTYSWTEAQVLHEISLATGKRSGSLMEAAFAHFDAQKAGSQYDEHPTIEGDTWLLATRIPSYEGRAFHALEVEFRPKGFFGDGRPLYYLTHNNNTNNTSMGQALDKYTYTIDYCNGKGASQAVTILKPDLLR